METRNNRRGGPIPYEEGVRKALEEVDKESRRANMITDKALEEVDLELSAVILNDPNTPKEVVKMAKRIRNQALFTRDVGNRMIKATQKSKQWVRKEKYYQDPNCPMCGKEDGTTHFVTCSEMEEYRNLQHTLEEAAYFKLAQWKLVTELPMALPTDTETLRTFQQRKAIVHVGPRLKYHRMAGFITKEVANRIRKIDKKTATKMAWELSMIPLKGLTLMWEERNKKFDKLCKE